MKTALILESDGGLRALLKRLGPVGEKAAKDAMLGVTKRIVEMAKPLTPVQPEDGGELRNSVRAAKPVKTRNGISAAVVAGGAPLAASVRAEGHKANVYAVVQHEDLTLQHSVGGPKFLERPFLSQAPSVVGAVQDALDKEVNRLT